MAGDDGGRRWRATLASDDGCRNRLQVRWSEIDQSIAMALVGDRSRWLATVAGGNGNRQWQATIAVAIAYDGVRSIALAGDDGGGGD